MYRIYFIVVSEHFRIVKLYTFIIRYRIEIKLSNKIQFLWYIIVTFQFSNTVIDIFIDHCILYYTLCLINNTDGTSERKFDILFIYNIYYILYSEAIYYSRV